MPTTDGHDVRYDDAGFLGNRPRLTCYSPGCNGATVIHQPCLTRTAFRDRVRQFLEEHPPKNGMATDADRLGGPLTVDELVNI